jgi:uncharacterized membrane protein
VSASALSLTLAAALIHASWNLILSGTEDTHSATAVAIVAGVAMFAPVAGLTWHVRAGAIPYIAGSAALEGLYLVLLATAYSRAAMGFVYPIARGSAPVIVLAISVLALGVGISAAAAAGVLLVAVGIVLVRGLRAARASRDLAVALGVGACIAGYTLVDQHGIDRASALAYLELVFAATAVAYGTGVWRARGAAALRAAINLRTVLAGAGFFASYALVLAALRLAPAPSVAAVRECSVVIATAFLAISGRERVTRSRFGGAIAVAAGIALVSLG